MNRPGPDLALVRATACSEIVAHDNNVGNPAVSDREEEFVAWAASFGPLLAEHAARHDADGTWVDESHRALREAGMLALAVPEELGGSGATLREVAMVMRELGRHCGSTALAMAMHQHATAFTAWRYRRECLVPRQRCGGSPAKGIVLVSTGGADFTRPRGQALRVEGGYHVSGHKIFASQSPVGTAMVTMFPYDDPDEGLRVLSMAVPMADPGITVHDNWNTLGMRGTASNDITVDDVFVPDERVVANRPYGVLDPPLQVIASIAMPIIAAVYLGIAESAGGSGDRRRRCAGRRSDRSSARSA